MNWQILPLTIQVIGSKSSRKSAGDWNTIFGEFIASHLRCMAQSRRKVIVGLSLCAMRGGSQHGAGLVLERFCSGIAPRRPPRTTCLKHSTTVFPY